MCLSTAYKNSKDEDAVIARYAEAGRTGQLERKGIGAQVDKALRLRLTGDSNQEQARQ